MKHSKPFLDKDFLKKIFRNTLFLLLMLALYYISTWRTGCPIKYFLGIACPGCGITRAWLAFLRLDFAAAFGFHPLFWLAALPALAIIFHNWIDFRKHRWLIALLVALFVTIYILRLFIFPDEIVNLDIHGGLLYQILKILDFIA